MLPKNIIGKIKNKKMQKPNNDIGITKTKICSKCKEPKEHKMFFNCKKSKDGLSYYCKPCMKLNVKSHNKSDKNKEYKNYWYSINKEKYQKYYKDNREKINLYWNNKYHSDPKHKLGLLLRGRVNELLKKNKKNKSIELLGCTIEEFKQHLELQFKPEMNWENHGKVWEVDHITPCDFFDLTLLEEQFKCFHFSNTQPLFKTTEIAKSFGYENEVGNRDKSKSNNI